MFLVLIFIFIIIEKIKKKSQKKCFFFLIKQKNIYPKNVICLTSYRPYQSHDSATIWEIIT